MEAEGDDLSRPAGILVSVARSWRARVEGALDLFFPPVCLACHGLVERDGTGFRNVCESCRGRLALVGEPHCSTCGYPFFGIKAENSGCPHCELLRPVYGEGRTAALLSGPMRRLIHTLKYEQGFHVLHDIGAVVRANPHFASFLAGAVLVPVPLHPRKRRERGFNQSELLAQACADVAGAAGVELLLRRVVDTATQTRLDRGGRRRNLENAFALKKGAVLNDSLRYVLVDDVFTTGATLNACARVLRRSGLTRIDVATMGHG